MVTHIVAYACFGAGTFSYGMRK